MHESGKGIARCKNKDGSSYMKISSLVNLLAAGGMNKNLISISTCIPKHNETMLKTKKKKETPGCFEKQKK